MTRPVLHQYTVLVDMSRSSLDGSGSGGCAALVFLAGGSFPPDAFALASARPCGEGARAAAAFPRLASLSAGASESLAAAAAGAARFQLSHRL